MERYKYISTRGCDELVYSSVMSVYFDEVEIEDFEYDSEDDIYYFPCPCGDQFQITKDDLIAGEEEATCPTCSLVIKVIYDKEAFVAKQKSKVVESKEQVVA